MTEEEVIAVLTEAVGHAPSPWGPGDDAALMAGVGTDAGRVVTSDAFVEGVHFLRRHPPQWLARKLLTANLADVASMGARPEAYTLAMCLPASTPDDWLRGFAEGLSEGSRRAKVALKGGDVTASPGPLMLCMTAWGQLPTQRALTRAQGAPGDVLMVTGIPGLAGAGWRRWRALSGEMWAHGTPGEVSPDLRAHLCPDPDLEAGPWALEQGAHAAMDLSDGLARDGARLALASGVQLEMDLDRLPPLPGGVELTLSERVSGGEDHELMVLVAARSRAAFEARGFTAIGRALPSGNDPGLFFVQGTARVELELTIFEHF